MNLPPLPPLPLSASRNATPDPRQTVDHLRKQLRKIETLSRGSHGAVVSTGCPELDQLLPAGGLSRGTVTEWVCETGQGIGGGSGAELLSLLAAWQACLPDGPGGVHHSGVGHAIGKRQSNALRTLIIIDPDHSFYPPAAAAWGIRLEHVVLIRCSQPADILWSIHQALQCPAVGAVWARFPLPINLNGVAGGSNTGLAGPRDLDPRWSRRFQLAAEQHGTMAMLVRSVPQSQQQRPPLSRRQPRNSTPVASPATSSRDAAGLKPRLASWAEVQWRVRSEAGPLTGKSAGAADRSAKFSRLLRVELQRARGAAGGAIGRGQWIQVDFATGQLQATSLHQLTNAS